MLKPIVLLVAVGGGAALGWHLASPLGLMGAYLCSVFGASVGLFIGRRIQKNLDPD